MWDTQLNDKDFVRSFTRISLDLQSNSDTRSYILDANKDGIDLRFEETDKHEAIHIRIENKDGAISILKKDNFTENLLTQKPKGE